MKNLEKNLSLWTIFATYLSYSILFLFGYFRDFLRSTGFEQTYQATERNRKGYVRLYPNFESFFTRNFYRRICDCWSHPICTSPGAQIRLNKEEFSRGKWARKMTRESFSALNMGSYNYLGFVESNDSCKKEVEKSLYEYGISVGSTRHEIGTLVIHQELEGQLARFLGVEDSLVVGMGFATNAMNIPSLVDKHCLILSDQLNHASLILGCRLSGATIVTFKHNDMQDLEKKIKDGVVYGHPKTRRAFKKILVIVEGVYSMEGTIVNLPEIIRLRKKYSIYVYLDEAHSIGALGTRGRGVLDYYGCDPRDVDILMGTFTKSFSSAGGYIAGNRKIINHLRACGQSSLYGSSMAAPIAQQILSTMRIIMGEDGTNEGQSRLLKLERNINYFYKKLKDMGFAVTGDRGSPVIPVLLCLPSKTGAYVRMCKERGVATVGVGYPAVPVTLARVRYCMSAAHSMDMLDEALRVASEVGDILNVKYCQRKPQDENLRNHSIYSKEINGCCAQ